MSFENLQCVSGTFLADESNHLVIFPHYESSLQIEVTLSSLCGYYHKRGRKCLAVKVPMLQDHGPMYDVRIFHCNSNNEESLLIPATAFQMDSLIKVFLITVVSRTLMSSTLHSSNIKLTGIICFFLKQFLTTNFEISSGPSNTHWPCWNVAS